VAAPPPLRKLAARGRFSVYAAVRASGKCPSGDFLSLDLKKLKVKDPDDPEATATDVMFALFDEMARQGKLLDKNFGKEPGKLWAFKAEVNNKLIRFPCFRDGSELILTHGFFKHGAQKGKGKWRQEEIDRANEIMAEYWIRKGSQ
jgi:hypothetical protein